MFLLLTFSGSFVLSSHASSQPSSQGRSHVDARDRNETHDAKPIDDRQFFQALSSAGPGYFSQAFSGGGRLRKPSSDLTNIWLTKAEKEELESYPEEPSELSWLLGYQMTYSSSFSLLNSFSTGLGYEPNDQIQFKSQIKFESAFQLDPYRRGSVDFELGYTLPLGTRKLKLKHHIDDRETGAVDDDDEDSETEVGANEVGINKKYRSIDDVPVIQLELIPTLDFHLLVGYTHQTRFEELGREGVGLRVGYSDPRGFSLRGAHTSYFYSKDATSFLSLIPVFSGEDGGAPSGSFRLSSLKRLVESFPDYAFELGGSYVLNDDWTTDLSLSLAKYKVTLVDLGYGVSPTVFYYLERDLRLGVGVDFFFASSAYSITGIGQVSYRF